MKNITLTAAQWLNYITQFYCDQCCGYTKAVHYDPCTLVEAIEAIDHLAQSKVDYDDNGCVIIDEARIMISSDELTLGSNYIIDCVIEHLEDERQ